MTEQELHIRKAALEEAAKICDEMARKWADINDPRHAAVVNAVGIRIRERIDLLRDNV